MKPTITSKVDYIPPELIEEILLNLPVKSLIRFSTASKLWNSLIFHPKFKKCYCGREMIVFPSSRRNSSDSYYSVCCLSSVSSDSPTHETTPFAFDSPSRYLYSVFRASCGNLWCVELEESLLLYNPSIHTYRKLPDSDFKADWIKRKRYPNPIYGYGLGYDSVCDDYKMLEIIHKSSYFDGETNSEIYSLRSDCWRKVESQPPQFGRFLSSEGLFVSGAFHWLVTPTSNVEDVENNWILSFDVSEEKFGQIELPEPNLRFTLDMIDFEGKLRVHVNSYYSFGSFSVWVMEDYGSKLWRKEMEIDQFYRLPLGLCPTTLRPFYFYDGAGNLVRAVITHDQKMFAYKEEDGSSSTSTLVEKNFSVDGFNVVDSLTYVESFALIPIPFNSAWEL